MCKVAISMWNRSEAQKQFPTRVIYDLWYRAPLYFSASLLTQPRNYNLYILLHNNSKVLFLIVTNRNMVEITPSLTSVTGPVFIPNHHGLNTAYISQCVTSCPLHNLFITDLNVTRLRGRAFVQLGNLDNLIQVADDGCVLSRALIEILSKDTVFQVRDLKPKFSRVCT